MQLMTLSGSLLVRAGSLATSASCCCVGCPVGQLGVWAYYFTDSDNIEVGTEDTVANEAVAEFAGTFFGFKLHVAFWVGNSEETPRGDGKTYYGEFQVWLVANCCESCDDFQYQNKAEGWAYDWSRITDPSSQFAWDPVWQTGSCTGLTIENDQGIQQMFDCLVESLSFPTDPATGAFVLRTSIEVCC